MKQFRYDLREAGLRVSRTSDGWTMGTWPHDQVDFRREHLEAALANLTAANDRRDWASLILAADLYEIDDDAVRDALWELAFGKA